MARPSSTGGKTGKAKASNASPAKGRETTKTKRRIAPAATRAKRRSTSHPGKDLKEAREQQAATAEILKVIASSPDDVQPVFNAIAASADRLIGGLSTTVLRFVDGCVHLAAFTPVNPTADDVLKSAFPVPIAVFKPFEAAARGEFVQVADAEALKDDPARQVARARGYRSVMFAPLMNAGQAIGLIGVTRATAGEFSSHHVRLLESFAAQAVIAIQNVRLFNEVQAKTRDLEESLQFQTASSDVLKVISRSPDALQPVLDAIAETSRELCGSDAATIFLLRDEKFHFTAVSGVVAKHVEYLRANPAPINEPGSALKQLALKKHTLHYPNVMDDPELDSVRSRLGGPRALLLVPLMRDGELLGTIVLRQSHLRPFTPRQIQAIETFADQAVIAIQNAQSFNETQEALERQTATADILKVIASSPSDVQPVFEAIATSSNRLLGGFSCTVVRFIDGMAHLKAFTPTTPEADRVLQSGFPQPVSGFVPFQNAHAGEVTQVPDTEALVGRILNVSRARGFRSMLFAPLVNKGEAIGVIGVTRVQVGRFADHHVQLLKTFADQAVIAIENVRLFDEVQAKTRDLTESLQHQTATADVLKVISRSAFDLESVLNTLVQSAVTLSGAHSGTIFQKRGDLYHLTAQYGYTPEMLAYGRASPIASGIGSNVGRTVMTGDVVQIPDVLADPDYAAHGYQRIGNFRAMLGIPLKRDGEVEGVFSLAKPDPGPFGQRQVELVHTFADQAVIAIENARLLSELRQSLQQQTATAEVLKVISRSTFDLKTVLETLVESAARLCGADKAFIFKRDGNLFQFAVSYGFSDEFDEYSRQNPMAPGRETITGRAALEGRTVHIPDVIADPEYEGTGYQIRGHYRTGLGVPLLREGETIGVFGLTRTDVRPFTEKQIELGTTFADQAVIAIENVRLFDEVQARTRELSQSLDELRTAQDRLIQTEKLAALGQLTAGIAHEIKNPLNFVNNFSALSAELTVELNDILKSAALGEKMRAEVDELTGLLKSNLEKVVQHGKRADSIVKNMLLHSREGSREHRPADINSLLDESLNLAYHGARAEKGEFNIILQRDFDADAGTIELFPQEVTRAFLNLIANGVYAATKRKNENKEPGFEPTLRATTKNLGTNVEIRIRDNGTGIPAEVKEKMFNPFFTTKPAGEGTGLGLSMTHDIIVKQHGGRIDVTTEPGKFTEFTIILPRNLSGRDRGET